jgi:chorismate mutase/prephenate dehydratase
MGLSEIRAEIDHIDAQLTQLICRRMDCSAQVAAYKAAHHLPVLNEERERQVLEQVRAACREYDATQAGYGNAAALIFSTMMDGSRALQHRQLANGQALRDALASADRQLLPYETARIVCQGCPGAYSDEAAGRLFPNGRNAGNPPRYVETFADVFEAIKKGQADYGILPVENSSTGSVNEVYDLIMANRFTIVAAVEVPIRHCLLALPNAKREQLTAVYSHPQGLSQCADYIAAHHLRPHSYSNTAAAAEMVARTGDLSLCAIASKEAGDIYGLNIIDENIQSVNNNSTRFIAISSKLVIPANADKISLIFALPHTTGSLYRTLAQFAMEGLNLTKIESRPIRNGDFEYAFYLDFEGEFTNAGTVDLLCALSEEMPLFNFLGNYHEMSAEEGINP